MEKKVVILPLDGYPDFSQLIQGLDELMSIPGLSDLLSHIKLNDGVHNPDMGGPECVAILKDVFRAQGRKDIGIFLDLKIGDVSATLENTLRKYAEDPPDILTVSTLCSIDGIISLRKLLPKTKLALLSILTDISVDECLSRYGMFPEVKIYNELKNIRYLYQKKQEGEPFDLVVCSPRELDFLSKNLPGHYGFIVPGIRDEWMKKKSEHQKRVSGVKWALEHGATYVVMGTQITKGNSETGISNVKSIELTQSEIARTDFSDPLEVLRRCDGYYSSLKNSMGEYVGPLVAYAGKYQTADGLKNYIGPNYFNFAKAESNPEALQYFAQLIKDEVLKNSLQPDVFLGAPMGGVLLAGAIGQQTKSRVIFSEKEIITLADHKSGSKEQSQQIISRHEVRPGDKIIIVEDVCNNFSTTEKLIELIKSQGGEVIAIACAFNRSGKTDFVGLPVVSAFFIPSIQFKQDDPEVVNLVKEGKVVWRPKHEWDKLK